MNALAIDEVKHLFRLGYGRHRKIAQQLEHDCPVRQAATGDLANDEWMSKHASRLE